MTRAASPIFPPIRAADWGGGGTAAGSYQITLDTWIDKGGAMGLSDFGAETQDLIAVEILRGLGALDKILAGDLSGALCAAARHWSALPAICDGTEPDQANMEALAVFEKHYRARMGTVDGLSGALSFSSGRAPVMGAAKGG